MKLKYSRATITSISVIIVILGLGLALVLLMFGTHPKEDAMGNYNDGMLPLAERQTYEAAEAESIETLTKIRELLTERAGAGEWENGINKSAIFCTEEGAMEFFSPLWISKSPLDKQATLQVLKEVGEPLGFTHELVHENSELWALSRHNPQDGGDYTVKVLGERSGLQFKSGCRPTPNQELYKEQARKEREEQDRRDAEERRRSKSPDESESATDPALPEPSVPPSPSQTP